MNIRYNADLIDRFVHAVSQTLQHELTPPKQALLRQTLLKSLTPTTWDARPPEYKEMTVLISDLRGFTAIAEQYPAKLLIEILNHYLSQMCEIIYRYGGTVDKFMGDSILALFGVHQARPDDLERAVACAVEMQRSMLEINAENTRRGFPRLFMGIGLNTGQVIAGQLGSELYNEYTVIGDAVNLASRIEAFSLRGQVLLSESAFVLARDFIDTGEPNQVLMKGKQLPVILHELFATRRPRPLEVPRVEARKSPRISVDFPMRFRLLRGNQVVQDSYEGTAIDLSYHGLQARLPIQLEAMSDLRIELSTSLMNTESRHIYAKVLRTQAAENDWLSRMEFTGIDDLGQNAIKQYIDQTIAQRGM